MRRGFTLLELIVVIIIIGILGTLGFTQYSRVIERSRGAEAKAVLGTIRTAATAYNLQNPTSAYPTNITTLGVDVPGTSYFTYGIDASGVGTATRCSSNATTCKNSVAAGDVYTINLTVNGTYGGTAGYF